MNAATATLPKVLLPAELEKMDTAALVALLEQANRDIRVIRCNAKANWYYKHIPEVHAEWNKSQGLKRTIGKILKRRAAHVAANKAALERNEVGAALAEV